MVQMSPVPAMSLVNAILPFAPGNAASAGPTPAARPATQAAAIATTCIGRACAGAADRMMRVSEGMAASGETVRTDALHRCGRRYMYGRRAD